ncbi:hypothetical protein [Streptomyces cyaneofuscatus]|uniref:hypothetical protein n=1 Tax=Streptomyces cyaneofuscatus TaxID=66883 RepID=UPI002E0FB665|nr:hypothetical protein OG366_24555 [Streptomyces cyaneofuscatus]WTF40314.1 hypothetical protein OG973_12195 [Streptomyces cyaneofuscatus]
MLTPAASHPVLCGPLLSHPVELQLAANAVPASGMRLIAATAVNTVAVRVSIFFMNSSFANDRIEFLFGRVEFRGVPPDRQLLIVKCYVVIKWALAVF